MHPSGSNALSGPWRADARRAWARRRTTRAKRRAEGRERARPNEAGQVRVNLHASLDQRGSQASERARASERGRPPVLKAVSRRSIASSLPKCMPRIMVQRVVVGKRVILVGDSEDVQGEPILHMQESQKKEPATLST